jgi:hypothetical protein
MFHRRQIINLAILILLVLTSLTLAKGDPYIEDPANEWGDLHNPTSVWSITAVVEHFGLLNPVGDVDAFAFDFTQATQNWPVKLFVPVCGEHFRSFYPSLALIGPGLDTPQAGVLPFTLDSRDRFVLLSFLIDIHPGFRYQASLDGRTAQAVLLLAVFMASSLVLVWTINRLWSRQLVTP